VGEGAAGLGKGRAAQGRRAPQNVSKFIHCDKSYRAPIVRNGKDMSQRVETRGKVK
jgi:hypothetical protein